MLNMYVHYADRFLLKFWAKVDKTDSCWLWTGCKSPRGYGVVGVGGKAQRAHRFSWTLHNGPIPNGMVVMHTCDTPLCVNPSHLKLGSQKDNILDAARKGRLDSYLTPDVVLEMRRLHAEGVTPTAISKKFNVPVGNVRCVVYRQSWKHV